MAKISAEVRGKINTGVVSWRMGVAFSLSDHFQTNGF
jgi:hypothetical protein